MSRWRALKRRELGCSQIGPEDRNCIDVTDSGVEVTRDHRPEKIGADQIDAESLRLAAHESRKESPDAGVPDSHTHIQALKAGRRRSP